MPELAYLPACMRSFPRINLEWRRAQYTFFQATRPPWQEQTHTQKYANEFSNLLLSSIKPWQEVFVIVSYIQHILPPNPSPSLKVKIIQLPS